MFSVEYANKAKKFLKQAEKDIVQRVIEKIEELRKEQQQSTKEIDTLFNVLTQKAFNGRLYSD